MQLNQPGRASFEKVVTSENQSVFWNHAISKQFRTAYHYHPEYELIHIQKGYGRRWVGSSIAHFGPGDLVFIAPNVPHMWLVAPDCPQAETFYVQFLPDFLGSEFFNVPEMQPIGELMAAARGGVTFSPAICNEINDRLTEIQTQTSAECLLSLLNILHRLSQDPDRQSLGDPNGQVSLNRRQEERISKVFQYINKHLTESISQAEIAKQVNLSPAALSRLFKNTTGKCFMEVVNELRIAQVCRLLAETNHTVSQIAYESGYETLSHFNSTFRKVLGITPRQYRKSLMELNP